mgnify:CR=1 FL=1
MKKQLIAAGILVAYCAILVKIMVFKDMPTLRIGSLMLNFSGTNGGHAPNFVPFRTILPYLLGHKGFLIAAVNLVGNIALLVPIGFLVPCVYRNITWKILLILAPAAGLTIEVMQVVLGVGIFDIDDILLNALGVMIGYGVFAVLTKWIRSRSYKKIATASVIVIAAAAASIYAIYPDDRQIVNPGRSAGGFQPGPIDKSQDKTSQGADPCGGTGGTGQIISVENNGITIKRNDGTFQTIKFSNRTTISSSAGLVPRSDLKAGDRVTLIIDESETASVVLICNLAHPKTQGDK